MTKFQLEKGFELQSKIDILIEAHLNLSQRPINSRVIPYIELTESVNTEVRGMVLNDLENQIKNLNQQLAAL